MPNIRHPPLLATAKITNSGRDLSAFIEGKLTADGQHKDKMAVGQ